MYANCGFGQNLFGNGEYGAALPPKIDTREYAKLGLTIRGKIGKAILRRRYPICGIYQMRKVSGRKRPIQMKFYAPKNPQTDKQMANRALFSAAVDNWHTFTVEQKAVYNNRAKGTSKCGYNVYIGEYIKNH
jgi:hypothetical protein